MLLSAGLEKILRSPRETFGRTARKGSDQHTWLAVIGGDSQQAVCTPRNAWGSEGESLPRLVEGPAPLCAGPSGPNEIFLLAEVPVPSVSLKVGVVVPKPSPRKLRVRSRPRTKVPDVVVPGALSRWDGAGRVPAAKSTARGVRSG